METDSSELFSVIKAEGFAFGFKEGYCKECGGRCCTGESGYMWISEEEAKKAASFLLMDLQSFAAKYLLSANGKLSLKEKRYKDGHACAFFDEEAKQCSIYEARPLQCQTFPFWERYKTHTQEAFEECPALIAL